MKTKIGYLPSPRFMLVLMFITFLIVLLLPLVFAALDVGFEDGEPVVEIVQPTVAVNYSTQNVNDSNTLQGYTPATLRDFFQITYDSLYCLLTGCDMTGNLTTIKDISVDGFYYGDGSRLDNVIEGVSSDLNNSYARLDSENTFLESSYFTKNLDVNGTINSSKYQDTSLVLDMRFNNNQSIDSSIYGNDGSFEGGANAEKDVAEFDGVDGRVKITGLNSKVTELTISACVNTKVQDDELLIIDSHDHDYDNRVFLEQHGTERWGFRIRLDDSGGLNNTFSTTKVSTNTWVYLEGVWNGTDALFYINRVLEDEITTGVGSIDFSQNTDDTHIGAEGRGTGAFFNGSIKFVKVKNRVSTEKERADDYAECNNYIYANTIIANNITTDYLQVEKESYFKSFLHIFDDVKAYFGDTDDVSIEFNGSDFVVSAEVGSPLFKFDDDTLVVDTGNNRVGIGTSNPTDILHIRSDEASPELRLESTSATGNPFIGFYQDGNRRTFIQHSNNLNTLKLASEFGQIQLLTDDTGIEQPRITILNSGLVGIGTTSPTHKLNVVGDVNITGNGIFGGNVTAENVFLPQYIFSHTNATIPLLGASTWTNITFDQENADLKFGIEHDMTILNHTFTVNADGVYFGDFQYDVEDTSDASSDIDVAGRLILSNGTEVIGSVFETDIAKKGIEVELSHDFLFEAKAGDIFVFQFIADDADVVLSTHGTFGTHPESVSIIIEKEYNLP